MKTIGTYKQKSNIITSLSIRKDDEEDYIRLRKLLGSYRIGMGEYLIDAFRELDKNDIKHLRLQYMR
tara:strand:- start:1185 stop:1385 length:201 start_codon:yes stop_codon:yes gene_type:complete